ncbi:MAG TPA: protein kinase [Isosphaeraceae bacterium]|nr:protein kinase [Isosphaeraceae bacterium]
MSQVDRQFSDEEDTLAWVVDGARVSLGDLTGMTIGDFQVERLLGRGGMGEVYLATQVSLNRPVALKVLRPDFLARPAYLDRFESEAMAVAKLNHPNIVHVYAMGRIDQIHYIAMEYVEGTNLRDYIRKKGAVQELPLALSIMKQTGQAIGAAGEAGLIHRDVKPENLLMTRRGRIKVADFGLCRDLRDDLNLTQTGVTMGTPLYMSPEQAQGHPLDHRSDLYSMGVTFYYMLAGVPPFHADSAVALALKHVREIPRSLLAHRPDLPIELDRLVMKLMAKDPADRYQSAALMLADLAKVREAVQVGATAAFPESLDSGATQAEESLRVSGPHRELALRRPAGGAVGVPATLRQGAVAAGPRPAAAPQAGGPAARAPAGFRGLVATLAVALGVCGGALAGWAARYPDLLAVPREPARPLPGLTIEPRWSTILRQHSPAEQLQYAQLQAPPDQWAAAWLAVPGYYPHSHEAVSKAYLQLARTWYRRADLDALRALASELAAWDEAQAHDKELIGLIRIALKLKTGDSKGVAEGFESLRQAGVTHMDNPALLTLSLEIGMDALQVAQKSENLTVAADLRQALVPIVRQLYRIEIGNPAGAGRANPAGKVASPASRSVGS